MLLVALAAPLWGFLSGFTGDGGDVVERELPSLVKSGDDRRVGFTGAYVPSEVLVKFVPGASEDEVRGLRVAQGVAEAYVSPFSGVRTWRVPPARSVEEWVAFFNKHPLVEYAEPNFYAYSSMVPDDPGFGLQWHLDNDVYGGIHAEAAWDMATGSPRVVVAVVDTGVAYEDNTASSFWHIDTYKAFSGQSWWCGVAAASVPYSWTALYGSTAAPGYGNGWKEYLQHAFDLRAATGTVSLSYQYRCDLEPNWDFAFVEVSSDGGYVWDQLKSYTSYGSTSLPAKVQWRPGSVDLTSYSGKEILLRFRVFSDEIFSDEDYDYYRSLIPPVTGFEGDGAFFVDEIRLTDQGGAHTIFYDDVESGAGDWVTNEYEQAPDLAGTSFWVNTDEIAGNGLDDDGNGRVDDVNGWDFVNQDAHPNDDNGHGTHVSGTIAQTTLNGLGVAGVAFGTTIMPVKVLDAGGAGTYQWISDGIYYAVNNGADIISMSLGGSASDITLQNAVSYAYTNGVVVVAAAGNGGKDGVGDPVCDYPAAYDAYVIAVGALQYDESKAPYSNYGPSLDVVAPGGNTAVDQNGDGYADGVLQNTFGNTTVDWAYWFYQGTSMATPHVSGVAALLLTRNPSLTPDDVRSVLQSTAEDLGAAGWDSSFGWGLVDAEAALRSFAEPVHLLLSVNPSQTSYSSEQTLELRITVFNDLNPPLDSTLTLTVTGPDGYYLYDFQPIDVEANEVKDYSFSWVVPDAAGRYVVEVGLVPAQLTAYDAAWLEVGVATAYFAPSDFAESSERWADAADQIYSSDFQSTYDYSQAAVSVQYSVVGETLTGTLRAQNLKPNFAYQLKLVGSPGVDGNERIGLAGRWWEQVWTGSAWSGGSNLNDKGTGYSPNPNDDTYFSRRDILDVSSYTGYHYKYTGYLLFAYFITDQNGDATVIFETGNSCHVLWNTDYRTRVADDGPLVSATFDPDGTEPAYDVDYPSQTVNIFGEWERLPMGEVDLAAGNYNCQMVLTEESFHGSGFPYGNWATVMDTKVAFTIG